MIPWCRLWKRRALPSAPPHHTRRCGPVLGERGRRRVTMGLRIHRDIDVLPIVLIIVQIEPTILVHSLLLRSTPRSVSLPERRWCQETGAPGKTLPNNCIHTHLHRQCSQYALHSATAFTKETNPYCFVVANIRHLHSVFHALLNSSGLTRPIIVQRVVFLAQRIF